MQSVFYKVKILIVLAAFILLFITVGSLMVITTVRESERETAEINFQDAAIQVQLMVKYLKTSINNFENEKRRTSDAKTVEKEVQEMKQTLINEMESVIIGIKVGKSGYPYVVDDNGNMVMYFNKELKKINFNDYKDKRTGQSLMKLLNEAKANKTYRFEYYWNKPNSSDIEKKLVIVKYDPDLKWNIVVSAYEDEIYETADKTQGFLTMMTLSICFLVILALIDSIRLIGNVKS